MGGEGGHATSPTAEAARAMARGHFERLPVVDAEDCLIGIVSRSDLLKIHLRTDEDLADQVRFELLAVLTPNRLRPSTSAQRRDGSR
ncbi:CBS domain-containing protein [Kitasatospora camelliae]|uniref:CBS domain-containing protein n=1 Tax=Kitasatospora camelliae TaxID=3156397 RepID=A0AAU8JN05_9ACTN